MAEVGVSGNGDRSGGMAFFDDRVGLGVEEGFKRGWVWMLASAGLSVIILQHILAFPSSLTKRLVIFVGLLQSLNGKISSIIFMNSMVSIDKL